MKYSAVIATNSPERMVFSAGSLLANSENCSDLTILYDGNNPPENNLKNTEIVLKPNGHDVYGMYNFGASRAKSDSVLFLNDDMYVSPSWDKVLSHLPAEENSVLTFQVVEPGFVDVASVNITKNFGMTINEFNKKAFDDFANIFNESAGIIPNSAGWYMPVIFPKNLFLNAGMYPTNPPFPYPNDIVFFEKLKAMGTARFFKANTLVYHFQKLSLRNT